MNPVETGYLRPRDPVEIWLARRWEDILGFGVGIRENFFGIGGNSLDAARVVNVVLDEFGVQLPLNVVTEHPTVESLAGLLRDQNGRLAGPLVDIQGGDGTRPPLFLIHPASGQVAPYCRLAHALGDEFTLFGLQAAGLYSDAEPVATVEAMAGAYLEAVRAAQPAGPYLLGGCSTGAAIAFHMACRLAGAGAEVRLLADIEFELVEPTEDVTKPQVWQANQDAVRAWRPSAYSGTLDIFRDPGRPGAVDRPPAAAQRVHDCAGIEALAAALLGLIG